MKYGKILGWSGQPTDGMGLMAIYNLEDREVNLVPCETAPTMRALREAFPDGQINGQYIGYETNDLGIMVSFKIDPGPDSEE